MEIVASKAVLMPLIMYAGAIGAEVYDQQGLNILVGQHGHGIHGPVVMDGEETIAVSLSVPDIGSCLGTGGGLRY